MNGKRNYGPGGGYRLGVHRKSGGLYRTGVWDGAFYRPPSDVSLSWQWFEGTNSLKVFPATAAKSALVEAVAEEEPASAWKSLIPLCLG